MARLVAVTGSNPGKQHPLGDVCLLGRSPQSHVYIGEPTVSRRHARLTREGSQYVLEDLGSGNGTFVNQRPVRRQALRNLDEVQIGNTVLRFENPDEQWAKAAGMVTVIDGRAGDVPLHTVDVARQTLPGIDTMRAVHSGTPADTVYKRLETVYAISNAITSILDPDELLREVMNHLFLVFPQAERGVILLRDAQGQQLVPRVVKHRDGRVSSEQFFISRTLVGQVVDHGRAVLSGDLGNDPRQRQVTAIGMLTMMCAPLIYRRDVIGVVFIDSSDLGRPFTRDDLDLLTGIGSQAGVAIQNARLHQEILDQQRLTQDLRFAEQVQKSFLPQVVPQLPGFSFVAEYDPAYEVGGDFYDFIGLADDRLAIIVGDVSGKGVSAALRMARVTSELRFSALAAGEPQRVLARANRAVLDAGQDEVFVTVAYLLLDPRQRTITLANAGHLPPFIRHAAEGQVTRVEHATSLALGVLAETEYEQAVIQLAEGDTVFLCTDGVIEAKNGQGELYGFERLQRAVAGGPSSASRVVERLLHNLRGFVGEAPQNDDLTVVAFGLGEDANPWVGAVGNRDTGPAWTTRPA